MPRDEAKPLPKLTQAQIAQFHAYLPDRPIAACWEWKGPKNDRNYGTIMFNYANYKAHRIAWAIFTGSAPETLCILHKCDNPPCCNPEHLWLGTIADNQYDASIKRRFPIGVKNHAAKLTPADVLEIRKLRAAGVPLAPLAAQFRISMTTISRIAHRMIWAHIA